MRLPDWGANLGGVRFHGTRKSVEQSGLPLTLTMVPLDEMIDRAIKILI
jgi:hypothetical protein